MIHQVRRRGFLRGLGSLVLAAPAVPVIFDMGRRAAPSPYIFIAGPGPAALEPMIIEPGCQYDTIAEAYDAAAMAADPSFDIQACGEYFAGNPLTLYKRQHR